MLYQRSLAAVCCVAFVVAANQNKALLGTKVPYEVVVEGAGDVGKWREHEFRGKPGDPSRLPRQFAPHHLRLD